MKTIKYKCSFCRKNEDMIKMILLPQHINEKHLDDTWCCENNCHQNHIESLIAQHVRKKEQLEKYLKASNSSSIIY